MELQEAYGYVVRPLCGTALAAGSLCDNDLTTPVASAIPLKEQADFIDLLQILDGELPLITPTVNGLIRARSSRIELTEGTEGVRNEWHCQVVS